MELQKPKILVVPGYLLYPYETGAGLAQFNFIDAIRHKADVSILLSPVNIKDEDVQGLKVLWRNVEFNFWQRPEQELDEHPSLLDRLGNKLNGIWNSTFAKNQDKIHSEKYNNILYNIENILLPSPDWMIKQLDDLLCKNKFDLIQFDLPINLGLGSVVTGRAKTLFVHHEIKFKRIRTIIEGNEPDLNELNKLQKKVEKRELEQLNVFDAIQVFTDEDRLELSDKLNVPVHVCPFSIADGQFRKSDEDERFQRLIFIGSDEHEPNLDGLDWLVNSWLPSFKSRLPVKLHVIGKWRQENRMKYSHDMIQFEGFVETLSSWWPNSVLIAPIRHGAGLRTKIMEAMAASVPIITTNFAIQGIDAEGGLKIAENGVDFERCINSYISDNKAFRISQDQVYQSAKNNFSSSRIIDKRMIIIDKTLT